ncbi:MAG: hypothetical protein RMI01_09870, partial [Thermodesulfovibrio sp.]|nr:hypothetical protein [Thermodesulfovibrio sp.]
MASIIKEVLKSKEFERLDFEGLILFPQGVAELSLSCNKQEIIRYHIKSSEEAKGEVKQLKEAIKHNPKASMRALASLLETPDIIIGAPEDFAFSIQFNQYDLKIGEEVKICKMGSRYYVKLHDKELSINAFIRKNRNDELKEAKLSLSISAEESPFE